MFPNAENRLKWRRITLLITILMITSLLAFAQSPIKTYKVHYTTNPPVQDGVISPGEYAGAAPPQGNFWIGISGKPSPNQYAWQALWDDRFLYIYVQSNVRNIPSQQGFTGDDSVNKWPGFVFSGQYEDVEFVFDPGNIAENLGSPDVNDSFQIAVQLVNGSRKSGKPGPPFLFTAARYNAPFYGMSWNPRDIGVGVNVNNGLTVEIAIPFSNLNRNFGHIKNQEDGEKDLEVFGPPVPGKKWAFQIARIKSNGTFELWSYQPGKSVTLHPYGVITFVKDKPGAYSAQSTNQFKPVQKSPVSENPFLKRPTAGSAVKSAVLPGISKAPFTSAGAPPKVSPFHPVSRNPQSSPFAPSATKTPAPVIKRNVTSPFTSRAPAKLAMPGQVAPPISMNRNQQASPFATKTPVSSPFSGGGNIPAKPPFGSQIRRGTQAPLSAGSLTPQQQSPPTLSPFVGRASNSQPYTGSRNNASKPPFGITAAPASTSPFGSTVVPPGAPSTRPVESGLAPFTGGNKPFGSASQPNTPSVAPVQTGNVYTDITAGKSAIKRFHKPGLVLVLTPENEDDSRIVQILELPNFKTLINNMIYIKVDINKNPKVMSRYGFYKTPSIVLYDSQGRMRKKIQSISDMNYLLNELQRLH